ncbi:DNRLRE domain-containing protein [Tepidibacter hydrothermalis]|uniref:DNRLRE domain-containing protein n=1 Tax=Tepidibacter hydrothermalis TaxID=3036126 RepID=A0ABY8EJM9_9FIRM|nr:DNRLRE domain-containing protein [Tepidibacter hydrothermalis]WFD11280.1 DNRLRE domain-containing protein [Tepidibacter hydrothermalis]
MRNIIIPASKSLTVSNKFPNKNLNDETISIGNDGTYYYHSYLFFDISALPDNISIHSAEIALFKVEDFFDCYTVKFSIYPILDYFSDFTTWENHPRVDMNVKKNFIPLTCNVCSEIDITDIVIMWSNNTLINKGLFLVGDFTKPSLTSFGSALNKDTYLIPFLRISFKELRSVTPSNRLPFFKLAYEVKS